MKISNLRQGNIILELIMLESENLATSDVEEAYEFSEVRRLQQIEMALSNAKRDGLKLMRLAASYGAECTALFQRAELHSEHKLGQLNASDEHS